MSCARSRNLMVKAMHALVFGSKEKEAWTEMG
jgi:hypothetical protein